MVLSREKEPVKFKGNKVWYLNKLSKMGADALGCKVPTEYDQSGNPIYSEETTIQDMIDYLVLEGGGGGSTPSAQPDRVIIIDTTLTEDIEGKAYSTFASAMDYMQTHPGTEEHPLYYCVELPAGEFAESVICSNDWLLHGNGTVLTEPAQTLVTADMTNPTELANTDIHIKDCGIIEGFYGTSDMAANEMPVFRILNCTVTNTIDLTTAKIISATSSLFDCEGDTEEKTKTYINCIVAGVNCQINRIGKLSSLLLYNSLIDTIIDVDDIIMKSCISAGATSATDGDQEIYFGNSLDMFGCDLDSIKIKAFDPNSDAFFDAYNCTFESLYLSAEAEVDKFEPNFQGCSIAFYDKEQEGMPNVDTLFFNTCNIFNNVAGPAQPTFYLYTSNLTVVHRSTTVNANSKSSVQYIASSVNDMLICAADTNVGVDGATLTNNYQPDHVMYSTDGGTTMTDDPISATHVGILKNPIAINANTPLPSLYVWVPLS